MEVGPIIVAANIGQEIAEPELVGPVRVTRRPVVGGIVNFIHFAAVHPPLHLGAITNPIEGGCVPVRCPVTPQGVVDIAPAPGTVGQHMDIIRLNGRHPVILGYPVGAGHLTGLGAVMRNLGIAKAPGDPHIVGCGEGTRPLVVVAVVSPHTVGAVLRFLPDQTAGHAPTLAGTVANLVPLPGAHTTAEVIAEDQGKGTNIDDADQAQQFQQSHGNERQKEGDASWSR